MLQGVAARHGLPEHRLQMGSPWSAQKPAAMDLPVTQKELEALRKDIAPVTGQQQQQQQLNNNNNNRRQRTKRGRGGAGGRGGGRGGFSGSKPAWQVIVEKRSTLCTLFNTGACTKTAETCQVGRHLCSKQTSATHLCLGGHAEKDCR